jgi:hypothetical protein
MTPGTWLGLVILLCVIELIIILILLVRISIMDRQVKQLQADNTKLIHNVKILSQGKIVD